MCVIQSLHLVLLPSYSFKHLVTLHELSTTVPVSINSITYVGNIRWKRNFLEIFSTRCHIFERFFFPKPGVPSIFIIVNTCVSLSFLSVFFSLSLSFKNLHKKILKIHQFHSPHIIKSSMKFELKKKKNTLFKR